MEVTKPLLGEPYFCCSSSLFIIGTTVTLTTIEGEKIAQSIEEHFNINAQK